MEVTARKHAKLIPLRTAAIRPPAQGWKTSAFYGKLPVNSTNRIDLVEVSEILFCKASSNYTNIVMVDGTRYTLSKTLKWTEAQLSQYGQFSRFHQSYVVNCSKIRGVDKADQWQMEMIGGQRLPISRSARSKLGAMLALGQA